MKIAWFVPTDQLRGGAEFALLESVKGLRTRGAEIVALLPGRAELAERLEDLGAKVHVIENPLWTGKRPARRFRTAVRSSFNLFAQRNRRQTLVRLLTQLSPDVVVTQTITIPSGAFAARLARIPHVWYVHEFFGRKGHNIFFQPGATLAMFLINHLSKRVILSSHSLQQQYQTWIPAGKIREVYCAVEVPAQRPVQKPISPRFALVYVASSSPFKRQEDAIRALARLSQRQCDISLTLIGDDWQGYQMTLKELAASLGVSDRVSFMPFTADCLSYVAAADLALMCSTGESFGRVTVEAMKLGKPVIGANSTGTCELIRNGWNGFYYRPGNFEELSEKIEILYRSPMLLRELGENARSWATQTFTLESHTSALLKVLEEACLQSKARPLTTSHSDVPNSNVLASRE